jgi:hypothetical protein
MDCWRDAEWASASQGATDMADEATQRRCIGSERFGIEPHEAQVEDFPKQPSQKDGLGRMCKVHWNEYTAGLARDAKTRKAAQGTPTESEATSEVTAEPATKRTRAKEPAAPVAGPQEGAG